MSSPTSVDSLPNELLEKVFQIGARLPMQIDKKYPSRPLFSKTPFSPLFPTTISQVCIRWRETALQMPVLWSFLHLSRTLDSHRHLRTSLGRSLDWLPSYLSRSADLPLYITLDTTRLPAGDAINLLNPYSYRWRSFTLLVSHVGNLPDVLPFFVTPRVPRLQTLSIASDIYREGIICYDPLIPFLVNATQLSTIRLNGVYIAWNELPLRNVSNLELLLTSRWPAFPQLSAMFSASPMLQRLVIHDDINTLLRHVQQPYSKPTIDLLRLKHLEIEVYRVREEHVDVAGLMQLFSIPALETLTLKGLRQKEWTVLTQVYHFPLESRDLNSQSNSTSRRTIVGPIYQRLRPSFPFLSVVDVTVVDTSGSATTMYYQF